MADAPAMGLPQVQRLGELQLAASGASAQPLGDDTRISVASGRGGGCTLELPGNETSLWIPLWGRVEVSASGVTWPLSRGEALVATQNPSVKAVGYTNSRWLVLHGGGEAWKGLLRPARDGRRQPPLPELHRVDREFLRLAVVLLRDSTPANLERSLRALGDKFASMQVPLQQAMQRCPGRTASQKRQVFLRLQRVRQVMSACCERALDVEALARMTSYSPSHFVRIFHKVYGTTPYAYLVVQRLERARQLLHFSGLAVTEIAMATGFENRMSFSRQFRSHFGMTAREAKRRANTHLVRA